MPRPVPFWCSVSDPILVVRGGRRLEGEVTLQGAKNAALPLMAASLLFTSPVVLEGVPRVEDIRTMEQLLRDLGAEVTWKNAHTVHIHAAHLRDNRAPYEIIRRMRASIYVLAPLLARLGEAWVSYPGGCAIGPRPIDFHLQGLEALGARIQVSHGEIHAEVQAFQGGTFTFPRKSVGATIQLLFAAAMARGAVRLANVAREPEVRQVVDFFRSAGVRITDLGPDTLLVEAPEEGLSPPGPVQIIPDRIEAGTLLTAAAITGGQVTVHRARADHLPSVLDTFREMGCTVKEFEDRIELQAPSPENLRPFRIFTEPFPGFPTDLQPQFLALATQIPGRSVIREGIYPHRFHHAEELRRLGARVEVEDGTATVEGGTPLTGAPVEGRDLRGTAALVLAGLAADGETHVSGMEHLLRGYEAFPEKLRQLGAELEWV